MEVTKMLCKLWLCCLGAVVILTCTFGILQSCKTIEIDLNDYAAEDKHLFLYFPSEDEPIFVPEAVPSFNSCSCKSAAHNSGKLLYNQWP